MQHEHRSGGETPASSIVGVTQRAEQTIGNVRTAAAYALAVALIVITITGLLAAILTAR